MLFNISLKNPVSSIWVKSIYHWWVSDSGSMEHSSNYHNFNTLALELGKDQAKPLSLSILHPLKVSFSSLLMHLALLTDTYRVTYRLHFEMGMIFISASSVHCILGILSACSTGNICLGTACGKLRYVFLTWVWVQLGGACVFSSLVEDHNTREESWCFSLKDSCSFSSPFVFMWGS